MWSICRIILSPFRVGNRLTCYEPLSLGTPTTERFMLTMETKPNRIPAQAPEHPPSGLVKCMLEHEKALKSFIRRSLDQDSDAEDIFQQLLEKTLKLDPAATVEQPLSYGYKMAQNLIIDFKRQQQRHPDELTFEPECDSVTLEDQLAYEQRLQIYQRCVAAMPALRRQVFIQRRLHGKSRAQIGADLGLQEEAVKKHISRAMSDLEQEIRRYRANSATVVAFPTPLRDNGNSEK